MPERPGVILAFDFGLRRIGIATGNCLTRTASPLTTLTAHEVPPWTDIERVLADWKPDRIVVGDPGTDAGSALREGLAAFHTGLRSRFAGPIETVDESHSSTAATEILREARSKGHYNRRLNKAQIDSQAACLIAEQWMHQAFD